MILRFSEAYESTPSGHHGLVYQFPFQVVKETPGARKDSVENYQLQVEISGTLLATWGFDDWHQSRGSALLEATLFEYVRDEVIESIAEEERLDELELSLNSSKVEGEYPFDVEQLTKPENFEVEINLKALKRRNDSNDDRFGEIGFEIPDGDDE